MGEVRSKCHGAEVYDGIAQGEVMDEKGIIHIEDINLIVCSNCHKPTEVEEKEEACPHIITVAINEEGHAGVYCNSCGEKVEGKC